MKSPTTVPKFGVVLIYVSLCLLCCDAFLPTRAGQKSCRGKLVQRNPSTLHLFFGGNKDESADKANQQLGFYPRLATKNTDLKFDSLATFIATWSRKFEEDGKGMGLTTPVKVFPLPQGEEVGPEVEEQEGVRIVFQATNTGKAYKSKDEEDAAKGGKESPKKKKGPPKEGGVELRVEKLAKGEVQLVVKRCEVDEDTMIKEMSEETILSELRKAVDVWKKQ